MRCLPCQTIYLEVRSRSGSAMVTACDVAVDGGKYYRATRTTYEFENGSYYVGTSYPEPKSINGSSCGDLSIIDTFDPETDYGAAVSSNTTYSDEITVSAADALGAIEWEEPTAAGPLASVPAAGWRGSAVSIVVGSVAGASGGGATAEASAVQIRVARGYRGLPIALAWLDELGGSGSLPIPTNGDWSDWLSVSGEDNSIVSAKIKVGRYI